MTRAVAQFVFTALLALFSAQAAMPSTHVVSAAGIVWCAETQQEKQSEDIRPLPVPGRTQLGLPSDSSYRSRTLAEPDSAVLFQRPPPATSLFS